MPRGITDAEKAILAFTVTYTGNPVRADEIVPIGRLIERGWVQADDGYEGPEITATASGIKSAKRLGLVKAATVSFTCRTGWERTDTAMQLVAK